jgi:hypothetical protein
MFAGTVAATATAAAVDYNFFSQHSSTSGLLSPPIFMPFPGGGGAGDAAAGGAEGAAGGAAAGAAGEARIMLAGCA